MRALLIAIGSLSLFLALAGIFLPLLPTTPFLLLSAYCFQKSSPRLHAWLVSQPALGPILRDWDENRVIRRRTKSLAITLLWLGLSWPLLQSRIPVWGKIGAGAVGIAVTAFLIRQKSY